MEASNKVIKRIILFLAVLFIGISINTFSNATYEVFEGDPGADNKGYEVHKEEGHWTFCMQHGKWYKANYSRTMAQTYPVGSEDGIYCTKGPTGKKPWSDGVYYTMIYSKVGNISAEANQDVAYILYKRGPDAWTNEANKDIWSTPLNIGNKVAATSAIAKQAQQYKNFYTNIHENGQDVFEKKFKDKTDYDNMKVGVNYDTQEYTVGPFEIEFPDGTYGSGKNKTNMFSWVNKVTAVVLLENGKYDELKPEVLDEDGKVLDDYGRDGKDSLNKTKFYLQFKSDKAIKVGLKVDYGYIESYWANMSEYEGTKYYWNWSKVMLGECSHTHHGTEHSNHNYDVSDGYYEKDDKGNETWVDTSYTVYVPCEHWIHGTEYKYVLGKVAGESTQTVLHVDGEAKENVKEGIYQDEGGPPIDLRMEMAGYVFLDQDQGKVNEGNSILDEDEGLPNTDVWVYDHEGKLQKVMLTDQKGYYKTGKILNAMKKYYVQFNYNGMLYEAVKYDMTADYNPSNCPSKEWKVTSKAKEDGREAFNSKFAEIGSYPSNYKIVNKMFGNSLGDYNRTYLQEEIVDVFKAISKEVVNNGGNLEEACRTVGGTSEETQRKVQFAADCRMIAYTDREAISVPGADNGKVYPVYTKTLFTVDEVTNPITIAGKVYMPIYEGQRYINYGIKARSTVDLALYKDVEKAEVSINGKTETYTYDLLNSIDANGNVKGFSIGVNESDYLNGLRGAYKDGKVYKNDTVTRAIETDAYTANMRKEEVTNAGSFDVKDTTVTKYDLKDSDRLNIEVVYKISIINQSSTTSAVTEVVDYYDNNFEFVSAYVGDKDGKQLGTAKKYDNSMYANSEYKSTKNAYKTIYIRPDAETRLNNNEQQFIYVRLRLVGQNRAGELLSSVLKSETDKLTVLNLAEINGYKTYYAKDNNGTPGLIDIDSNPGNLNISNINGLTQENIVSYPNIRAMYEDDTRRAPAIVYGLYEERTLSGTVFEDNTGWNNETIHTGDTRKGNGQLDDKDTGIQGVQVELVEMKNNQLITRASTFTDQNGNYKFSGFVPGNYTIRYTYGKNQETALSKNSKWYKGVNEKSYNGQDFQSTIFTNKTAYYWYTDDNKLSDAVDDETRKNQVIAYSDTKIDGESADYNVAITNHKAEVFKSYEAEQPEHITKEYNASLVNELASKTYRYAYTPEIAVEVEYATQTIAGTQNSDKYAHNITGVDFGIVERPRSELVIDQDVARVKVTAADGITVLFDSDGSKNVSNLNWTKGMQNTSRYHGTKIEGTNKTKYTNGELVNVIMDEELMSGAKIEITYKFTVTNNGEADGNSTTAAKTIVNYVANNLDFDASANKDWTVVKVEDIQNNKNSTFVNNTAGNDNLKLLDLSTQSTILKTTSNNALTKALAPGEQATATLTLSKVMSTESAIDMLSYSNIAEIVEIANTVGRYDRGATPGNQDVAELPEEHDTTGVVNGLTSDATVIVTPPTGSQYIYYIIGIASAAILAGGIILIKKFVIDKNK